MYDIDEVQQYKKMLYESISEAVAIDEERRRNLPVEYDEHGTDINAFRRNAFIRERLISEADVVTYLLAMTGGGLKQELHRLNPAVRANAFVQRRKAISPEVFEDVFNGFNLRCWNDNSDIYQYNGYRVLAVDGSTINLFRNPDTESYMKPTTSNPKGMNQLHLNAFYDVENHTYFGCNIQPEPQKDEIGALYAFMRENNIDLPHNTIIIADRGYESYNTFASFYEYNKTSGKNVCFLVRVKNDNSAMREVKKLPMEELDTDISFTITTTQTKTDKENGYIHVARYRNVKDPDNTSRSRWDFGSPYPMTLRIVRFQLTSGEYETLATNLPRDDFPMERTTVK